MDSKVIAEPQRPNHRHWRDLSKWRLLLGLAAAPVLPVAFGTLLLAILDGDVLLGAVASILAVAEIWSMIAGTGYLVFARLRGGIRRAECILLGAFLAFTLPFAADFTTGAIDRMSGMATPEDEWISLEGPSDSTFALVVGLMLIPFGVVGGWVFWRVGVRPAQPKEADVATVFD
jgi:hypothetical protein